MGQRDKVSIAVLILIISVILCGYVTFECAKPVKTSGTSNNEDNKIKPETENVPPHIKEFCSNIIEKINSKDYGNIYDAGNKYFKNKGTKEVCEKYLKEMSGKTGTIQTVEMKSCYSTDKKKIYIVFMSFKSVNNKELNGIYIWIDMNGGSNSIKIEGIKYVKEFGNDGSGN